MTKFKYLVWLACFNTACRYMRLRSAVCKWRLKHNRPRHDALQTELLGLSVINTGYRNDKPYCDRLPLWARWRMRDIHRELGSYYSPGERFLIFSKRAYRAKLRSQRKLVNEIIDEILAEERAAQCQPR